MKLALPVLAAAASIAATLAAGPRPAVVSGDLAPAGGRPVPTHAAAPARQAEPESEVRAIVERVFEGMRTADSALVRTAFAPDARFSLLDRRSEPVRVIYMPIDGWLEAIANSRRRWDERLYDVAVQVDQDMASVWAPYTFYLDGEVRHCGIDSIELLRSASGWVITQLADTRRTTDCPDPR